MLDEKPQENTNIPSENSQEDVNNLTNDSTINPETDQNMELYHPHPKHHERKLKDYFYEFFMLFIAITAGFFMENLREEYVENHREHQYVESLAREIQQDTTEILDIIENNKLQVEGIDSLLKLLEKPGDINLSKLYLLSNEYIGNLEGFTAREVTITQLRNTGALRLIDNKSISDSIVLYYSIGDSHKDQQRYLVQLMKDNLNLTMKALDYSVFRVKNREKTFDMNYIKEFYNRALIFKSLLNSEIVWMNDFHKQGVSLLKYLKKEYKLE